MLSSDDKHRVLFALCHNGRTITVGSMEYNSFIDNRLNGLNSFTETQVLKLLDQIELSKSNLSDTSRDNIKRIEDIEFDTSYSRTNKLKELSRLQNELSNLLDIPNRCKSGGVGTGCLIL